MIIDIYDKDQVYYPEYKSCCVQNCIRQVLEYYGIAHSHLLINIDFNVCNLPKDYFIVYDNRILLGTYDDILSCYDDTNADALQIWERNKASMYNLTPVIVGVDTYYLPYDINFNKIHSAHMIIICGYDELSQEVMIIDVGERAQYKGQISLTDYLLARNSINPKGEGFYSGFPISNTYIDVSSINSGSINYKELILSTFDNILEYIINLEDKNPKCNNLMQLLLSASKLSFDDNIMNDDILDKLYADIYYIARNRRLFVLYLKHMKEIYLFDVNIVMRKVIEIVEKWKIAYNLLIKVKLSHNEKTYRRFVECFSNALNLEIGIKKDICYLLDLVRRRNEYEFVNKTLR